MIDFRAAFRDPEDDERSNPESQELPSPEHSPPPQYPPHPPAVLRPRHADLDLRKAMLAAGGPNYETVLHDADTQMGPDSENIPSERCGGEARRANLKQRQGI